MSLDTHVLQNAAELVLPALQTGALEHMGAALPEAVTSILARLIPKLKRDSKATTEVEQLIDVLRSMAETNQSIAHDLIVLAGTQIQSQRGAPLAVGYNSQMWTAKINTVVNKGVMGFSVDGDTSR